MVIKNLRKIRNVGLLACAFGCLSLNAQQYAYVTNVAGNSVSLVDLSSNTVVGSVYIPGSPTGIGVSPSGDTAYVATPGTGKLTMISAAARSAASTIDLGAPGAQLAVSPNGNYIYIVSPTTNQLVMVDLGSRSVIGTVPVGVRPNSVTFNPTGTRAYVANLLSGNVTVVDTASHEVVSTFTAGSGPSSVATSEDGNTLYVTNQYEGTVTVHKASGELQGTISGFAFPNDSAITPDGKRLFVTNGNGGSVAIVDCGSRNIVRTVPTGSLPTAVALDAQGSRAYVTNQYGFSLSVIDVQSGDVLATVSKVGVYPIGVALTPPVSVAPPTPPPPPTPVCTYTVSSTTLSLTTAALDSSIRVTAPAGCPWTAASNAAWVRITSGASGNGDGSVNISVDANATLDARSTTLTIAGKQVSIAQAALVCSFVLSANTASLTAAGGTGSVALTTLGICAWNASSDSSWLTVGTSSGIGPATLTFAAAANPNATPRTATLTLGGKPFTVVQAAVPFNPIRVSAGGSAFTDAQGRQWAGDDQHNRSTTMAPIANTDLPQLYQSEAWGDSLTYQFQVPNGPYSVTLRFAEIYLSQPDQRTFNILINGQTVASNVDVMKLAGKNTAYDKTFPVAVTNGQIAIQVVAVTGTAKISGIEITQ